jgi:hypothetical protein
MSENYNFGEVDMDEMRGEYEATAQRKKAMKLQEGRNTLRVLPPPVGEKRPFKVFWVHGIGNGSGFRSFQCPEKTLGENCPACDRVSALYRTGNPADRELANRMRAKREAYCNVVDILHQDKGVQVLKLAEGTYRDLLGFMVADEKTGEPGVNFTHPINGMNVVIHREGTDRNTKYKCELSRTGPKPLANMDWLNQMNDLTNYVRSMPAEQVVALIEGRELDPDPKQIEAASKPVSIDQDPDLQ